MEKHITKQAMFCSSGNSSPADSNRLRKCILIVLLLAGIHTIAIAQNKRQVRAVMREANADYEDEGYASAWQLYRRVLGWDPANKQAALKAAVSAVRLNYAADSLMLLDDKLQKLKAPDAMYYLARIRHQQKKFDEALTLLQDYGKVSAGRRLHNDKEVARQAEYSRNAKQFIAAPTPARIRNMGPTLNSEYADYVPVILPDESALYFTSRRENPTHPKRNGDNTFFEDVYVSYKKNGGWTYAESVGFPINTETNDACVAISPDGQRMIIYRTAPDLASGDLYITRLGTNDRWQPLEMMSSEINSPYIETSACFSMDTNEIFFSSDRPGGMGGKDLYRIKKLPDGRWSPAMNLGPTVNTSYDDDAPYLHPDGVTLYYSSKGHNSMGEFDVFRSAWSTQDNKFSPAENLGYPINDVGNDIFFVLNVDGQRAYYSSSRPDNLGGTDLYEIDTRFGQNDLQIRSGRVVLGTQFGRARITLTEKETGALNGYYTSNGQTGKFILVVNPHKTYQAEVEAEGFEKKESILEPKAFENGDGLKFILNRNSAQ